MGKPPVTHKSYLIPLSVKYCFLWRCNLNKKAHHFFIILLSSEVINHINFETGDKLMKFAFISFIFCIISDLTRSRKGH